MRAAARRRSAPSACPLRVMTLNNRQDMSQAVELTTTSLSYRDVCEETQKTRSAMNVTSMYSIPASSCGVLSNISYKLNYACIPASISISNLSVAVFPQTPRSVPLSVVQWIMFAFGTVGNFSVLCVLLWHRSFKNHTMQLFIGSLAVANVGTMLGNAWIQALFYVDQRWKFGRLCCQLYNFVTGLTFGCSTWTLAVVAVDR